MLNIQIPTKRLHRLGNNDTTGHERTGVDSDTTRHNVTSGPVRDNCSVQCRAAPVYTPKGGQMTLATPLYVCAAIILSSIVIVATTSTGLQRTPFCILPSLGITVMIWMAYPPAQQLSPII